MPGLDSVPSWLSDNSGWTSLCLGCLICETEYMIQPTSLGCCEDWMRQCLWKHLAQGPVSCKYSWVEAIIIIRSKSDFFMVSPAPVSEDKGEGDLIFYKCLQCGLLERQPETCGSHLVPGSTASRPQSEAPGATTPLVSTNSIKSTRKSLWKALVLHLDHFRSLGFSQLAFSLSIQIVLLLFFIFAVFTFGWGIATSHWTWNQSWLCLMLCE